jgi:hypothetical protein
MAEEKEEDVWQRRSQERQSSLKAPALTEFEEWQVS